MTHRSLSYQIALKQIMRLLFCFLLFRLPRSTYCPRHPAEMAAAAGTAAAGVVVAVAAAVAVVVVVETFV